MSVPHHQHPGDRQRSIPRGSCKGVTSPLTTNNLPSSQEPQDVITETISPRTAVSVRLRSLNLDLSQPQHPRHWLIHEDEHAEPSMDETEVRSHISETPPRSPNAMDMTRSSVLGIRPRVSSSISPSPPVVSIGSDGTYVSSQPVQTSTDVSFSSTDGPSPAKRARIMVAASDNGDGSMRAARTARLASPNSISTVPETPLSSPPDQSGRVATSQGHAGEDEQAQTPKARPSSLVAAQVEACDKSRTKRPRSPPPKNMQLTPGTDQAVNEQGADLWWREDEIIGYYPSDPDEDSEGVNGVGYQKSRAEAWRIGQLRKKQIEDWRIREQKDARVRRQKVRGSDSEHRVMLGRVTKSGSRSGSPVEKRSPQSLQRIKDGLEQKSVRFMVDE